MLTIISYKIWYQEFIIMVEKNLINRCLNNIIDNALKYANKVEIKLNKKDTNLFIIIDDDGPGIPSKEHENVFKPFYKIDKGRADSKIKCGSRSIYCFRYCEITWR